MRAALACLLVVVACGGISKRTVEDDPAAGTGGQAAASSGGTAARGGGNAGGSGGSVAAGGTAGSPDPGLPDPCGIGWLDIPTTCPPEQMSILEAPLCNAMFRCYLGSACGGPSGCALCLQAFKAGLMGTTSLCVHGTLSELDTACLTAPPAGDIAAACVP